MFFGQVRLRVQFRQGLACRRLSQVFAHPHVAVVGHSIQRNALGQADACDLLPEVRLRTEGRRVVVLVSVACGGRSLMPLLYNEAEHQNASSLALLRWVGFFETGHQVLPKLQTCEGTWLLVA